MQPEVISRKSENQEESVNQQPGDEQVTRNSGEHVKYHETSITQGMSFTAYESFDGQSLNPSLGNKRRGYVFNQETGQMERLIRKRKRKTTDQLD